MNNEDIIERGGIAAAIEASTRPLVQQRVDLIINQLVSAYRSGALTHDLAIGKIGELSALDEFMDHLENMQRRGFIAKEKEFGDV